MRSSLIATALVLGWCGVAGAKDPPLLGVEAFVAGGVMAGGGSGVAAVKTAPFTAGAKIDYLVMYQPKVSLWAEAFAEASLKQAGAGLGGGVRLRPGDGGLRLGAGAVALVMPYTAFGLTVTGGYCYGLKKFRLCGDLEWVALLMGDDVPANRVANEVRLVLGVGFDAM